MKKLFGDAEFIKKLILIALPIGLQTMVNMFVNLIDTIMVGRLGDIALSSVNISSQFPFLYVMGMMGLCNGGMILAAQAWGNKRKDIVKAMTAYLFRLCGIANIVFFLLAFLIPGPIISIYTNNAGIIETGTVYLRMLSWCFLFQSFPLLFVTLLRSIGEANLGFVSSVYACLANVFFNWVFIFGNLGFPAMGVLGAAVGTVMARVTELIVVLVFLIRDKKLQFRPKDLLLKLEKPVKQDFYRIGLPSLVSELTGNLNVSAAAMITGRVSEYYIAANSIVHNIWTISSLFLFGIATGANVIIGHMIGAKEIDKAKEASGYIMNMAILIGLGGAVLIHVLAPLIISFFNVSEMTVMTAQKLKNAASVIMLFMSLQMILTKGVLRGGGQAAAVTRVDLISCWLVNIPVGYFVALVLKADPFWIYLSLRCDYFIKSVWGIWKIRKTDWIIRLNVD